MDLPYTMSLCSEGAGIICAVCLLFLMVESELARIQFNKYKAVSMAGVSTG